MERKPKDYLKNYIQTEILKNKVKRYKVENIKILKILQHERKMTETKDIPKTPS